MRLIDADELEAAMYHEAFETDSDMQKWDSGCWIRYKMFENVLNSIPTIDTCPVYKEKFKNPCETCTELYCVRDCEYYEVIKRKNERNF